MFFELEMGLIENDVVKEVKEACAEVLGNVVVEVMAQDFDATIVVHDVVRPDVAHAIARRLRGGRDFDASRAADWHVRSIDHEEGDGPEAPTTISLSQSFSAPEGYQEIEEA